MQLVLGTILKGNDAELFDDESPNAESYSFGGLQMAINEGSKRISQNPDIQQINIYEIFDGVRRASPHGKYAPVYTLFADNSSGAKAE
jgi:hypothetical protein